jgi:plasmid stability protein
MPVNLLVRNVDDQLAENLKRRAARHGRSAEAEHRAILHEALARDVDEADWRRRASELRSRTAGRVHTPAEALQREGRDER